MTHGSLRRVGKSLRGERDHRWETFEHVARLGRVDERREEAVRTRMNRIRECPPGRPRAIHAPASANTT